MTIIGIDPGKTGGIAWSYRRAVAVEKMPESVGDIHALLRDIKRGAEGHVTCYLEKVSGGAFGGQRMAGAFTFGEGFGCLQGLLYALEIPVVMVPPQKWQKALGCMSGGDKNVTKRRAQQLFPALTITHATADALLICHYGRTQP